jgi:ribosomal protein S18 acetylase RimI-like enzyme
MEISLYQPQKENTELRALITKKYGASRSFEYFLTDFEKAFRFCVDSESVHFYPIAAKENGKLVAHIALIIDKRLPAGEAFFGFFEVPNDRVLFDELWHALITLAKEKGIATLKGPVNGSIWHQYRAIKNTDRSDFFKAEPISDSFYYELLTSKKPNIEVNYYSASREPFERVLTLVDESAYSKLEQYGFSIKVANTVSMQDLGAIAAISKTVFQTSWGYTELTQKEFMDLYSPDKMQAHLNSLYVLYKGEEIIGFCSTGREDEKTVICKTIAVLPQYQGLGLGNALAYKLHIDAKAAGFSKMIYALIREGNNIKNFPKEGAKIFRQYAAFEFTV